MVALARYNEPPANVTLSHQLSLESPPEGRGSNWIHPQLAIFKTNSCGYGVMALAPIAAGSTVVVFGGKVITTEEFAELSHEMQNFPFQIADDLFLGPQDETDIGVGERINHSCAPNLGFSGPINLVALRNIVRGEEVTIDYATCVASDNDAFVMECQCKEPSCRKSITGHDWKSPDLQIRLFEHFQPFIKEKILQQGTNPGIGIGHEFLPVSNTDLIVSGREISATISKVWTLLASSVTFLTMGLKREWMAIPICVLAGIPSTVATILIMAAVSPTLRYFEFAKTEAGYISVVSFISGIVGYATYLIAYYAGMLWKERREWIIDHRVNRVGFLRQMRVIKCDFLAHLPTDFWVMPLMGAATGGFFVAGAPQPWAIFLAHTIADVTYAIKEPLFWHGAKQFVAWHESRNSSVVS